MINWFKGLPLYLQIIILVILAFIAYQIFKWFKTKFESGIHFVLPEPGGTGVLDALGSSMQDPKLKRLHRNI